MVEHVVHKSFSSVPIPCFPAHGVMTQFSTTHLVLSCHMSSQVSSRHDPSTHTQLVGHGPTPIDLSQRLNHVLRHTRPNVFCSQICTYAPMQPSNIFQGRLIHVLWVPIVKSIPFNHVHHVQHRQRQRKQTGISERLGSGCKDRPKKQEDGNTKTLETRFAFLCPPGSPSNPRLWEREKQGSSVPLAIKVSQLWDSKRKSENAIEGTSTLHG